MKVANYIITLCFILTPLFTVFWQGRADMTVKTEEASIQAESDLKTVAEQVQLLDKELAELYRKEARRKKLHRELVQTIEKKASQIPLGPIAIYSPSYNNFAPTEVANPEGTLTVRIVTIYNILKIKAPKNAKQSKDNNGMTLTIPYRLKNEEKIFSVEVITNHGGMKKEFTIRWVKDVENRNKYWANKKANPWAFFLITGINTTDNIDYVPDDFDKINATKFTWIFKTKYKVNLWGLKANINAMTLRERHFNRKYKSLDLTLNQLTTATEMTTALGNVKLTLGINDIGVDNYLLSYKNHLENDYFFKSSLVPNVAKTTIWDFKYTNKNMGPVKDEQYNPDASLYELGGKYVQKMSSSSLSYSAKLLQNKSVGPYLKYQQWQLALKYKLPKLGVFRPETGLGYQKMDFTEEDPLKGVKESRNLMLFNGKLVYPLKPKTILSGEIKHKQQTSNVKKLNYKSNFFILNLIKVF